MHKEMERTEEELGRRKNLIYCIKNVFFKEAQHPRGRKENEWGNLSTFQMWLTAV